MIRFCRVVLTFWLVTTLAFITMGAVAGGLLGKFCPDYYRASVHGAGDDATIDYVQYAVARNVQEWHGATITFVLAVLFFGTLIEMVRAWRCPQGGQKA